MIKWLIIPLIIIFFTFRGCLSKLEKGVDVGSEKFNENAQKAREVKLKDIPDELKYLFLRFIIYDPQKNYIVLENGAIIELGKPCLYGLCTFLNVNYIVFVREDKSKFYIFRNELMLSELSKRENEFNVTDKQKNETKVKKELKNDSKIKS